MNVNFAAMPTSLDAAHLGLALLALLFLLLFLFKKGRQPTPTVTDKPVEVEESMPIQAPRLKESSPDAALQLLALLQQEARFIDFIQEDLGDYSDADIGAAARVVHEGCSRALREHLSMAPIRLEEEGARVTLQEGFNASEVRLTGNVLGKPPFTGTLVHRGWRATEFRLPKLVEGHEVRVLAPAEVEL